MSRGALLESAAAASAACLAGLIALTPAGRGPLVATLALAVVVGWIVWRDMRDFVIPDGAAAALGALAFGARLAADGVSVETSIHALGGGIACGTALWAVREGFFRLRGHDGLGFGDVKLAVAAGVLVGPGGFALALLAACLAGLGVVAVRGAAARAEKLPLGALLAPAAFGVWALGLSAAFG